MTKGSWSVNQPGMRKALNSYFLRKSGGNNRFRITSPYPLFPEAAQLDERFDKIKSEVSALVRERSIRRYGDVDPVRAPDVSEAWRIFYAYALGEANPASRTHCPTLIDFAERTPTVVNAMVAILDPGVALKAHEGPYAGILRYHLPLVVPKNRPPTIRVDKDLHTWKEREPILIDDTFEHEVYNESDGQRVIVMVDFRRPMGSVADGLNRFALRIKRKWSAYYIQQSNGDI